MMAAPRLTRRLAVYTPDGTELDVLGDVVEEFPVEPCYTFGEAEQLASVEGAQATTSTTWRVILAGGVDVTSRSRIHLPDVDQWLEVSGVPAHAYNSQLRRVQHIDVDAMATTWRPPT